MNEYYYNTPSTSDSEIAMVLMVFLGVFAVALLALAFWIIRSLSLYTIAKRRGIRKPWLSWIPIGNMWILGLLSDQYQHLVNGKVTSRRKILLTLDLVALVPALAGTVLNIMSSLAVTIDEEAAAVALVSMVVSLVTWAISITALIFYHMCNYDLYRSCDPKNAVAFLVIGIIFGVTEPFFYLVNRKKDLGMTRPEPAQPVCEEPVQPVPAEPVQLPEMEPRNEEL